MPTQSASNSSSSNNSNNKIKIWRQTGNRKLIIGIFGFCLSILGILLGMFWEQIFNGVMQKEMRLHPDSRAFRNWKNPPLELKLDIYLFNWTNPEDFRNLSTKPILEQCGPYRFIEKPDKVDIVWHPENASVTYRKRSLYYFDAAGSQGSLDDEIITLNAVALSAAGKAKQWGSVRRNMVDVGLKIYLQEMSVIKTVDELLFSGYSDDMLDMARAMPLFGNDVQVPFDKFGWFYTRNGSADLTGVFNVFTGADDIVKLGQMHTWNYKTNTGFFDSHCGMANGSAGEFHPQNLQENGSVGIFTPDMCRTVPLDYVETVLIEDVPGFKYAGGPRSVDNGTLYPENACFCGGKCSPSGVMNISACRFDSPVFMSYPHFYNADPYYVNQVEGLTPNKLDHEFYMTLEPHTGIALDVAARFQVNMLVEPIEGVTLYENVPRIYFPLIWFEQKVRITPELADELKLLPYILLAGQIVAGVIFAIGLVLLCWYPIEQMWQRRSQRNDNFKTQNKQNGHYRSKSNFSSSEELKSKASTAICEKSGLTPDNSPLLTQSKKNQIQIVPKSETAESVATATTTASDSLSQ